MSIFRMLSTLGGLAAAACVSLAAQAAHAQGVSYAQAQAQGGYQIPPGSYQQSCQNIRIEGSILRATCTNIAGQRVPASIDLSTCRNRELNNNNGALFCAAPYTPAPQPQRPPVGSYQDSCRDAVMRGSILSARCTTRTGAMVNASIDVNTCGPREIYNDNGVLRCSGFVPPPQTQMPGGTWFESCRDGALRGNVLTARCNRRGGQPVMSSLDLSTCRTREVMNDNGALRCVYPAPQAQVPQGSYLASCRDATLRGNILTARCTRGNQPAVVSSLDVSTCRGRDIINAGGYLQCGGIGGPGRGGGRGPRDDFEAVLYTGTNYRGQSILVTEPIPSLTNQSGFNDTVRSIRLLRGSVEICQDPNYGRCVTLDASAPDLAALRMDRVISSIRGGDDGFPGRGRGRGFGD